jgi:hypothetical protein
MSRPLHPFQPSLYDFNGLLWLPNGVDGTGRGLGSAWTVAAGNTVTHPAPANTNFVTQLKRTIYANDGTTNRTLGAYLLGTHDFQFWRGNSDRLGGFYMSVMFSINAWANNAGRLFIGLADSVSGLVADSDTVAGDIVGLWHDSTMGANVLKLMSRDGTTKTEQDITGVTLAAGQGFLWEMWGEPNPTDNIMGTKLTSLNTGAKIQYIQISTNSPRNTIMMAPQVHMSNGADTTPNNFSIGIMEIYLSQQITRT